MELHKKSKRKDPFDFNLIISKTLVFIFVTSLLVFMISEAWSHPIFAKQRAVLDEIVSSLLEGTKKGEINAKNSNDPCYIDGQKFPFSPDDCIKIRNAGDDEEGVPINEEVSLLTPTKKVPENRPTPTSDPDPIVSCELPSKCGGGTRETRLSLCQESICCNINGGWENYESASKCRQDQANGRTNNNNNDTSSFDSNLNYPTYSAQTKISCAYSNGEYQYDFGELTYEECQIKSKQYWNAKNAELSTSNSDSYANDNPIDTSACYRQYESDVSAARTYGGNVGSAAKEIAQTNLDRCISTGQVTEMGRPQIDSRPKDRDGKLCSEYGPELEGYSKSMGCP